MLKTKKQLGKSKKAKFKVNQRGNEHYGDDDLILDVKNLKD